MNKKGFALIELLIVVVLIGLLSTLAVIALQRVRIKACAEGDYKICKSIEMTQEEAKKKLSAEESEDVEENKKENKCDKDHANCRYNCANEDNILNDCLERCEIKYEYCIDKIED